MNLFYETRGAGEPLILIPGFAAGAWIWRWQVEDLSEDFQVVTFDPRGVGQSKINENAVVSLETIAADIAGLLDDLKIEKANVLGASFGGFVAQQFALSFPERLNKLILACTSAGGKNHVAPELEILAAFVSTGDLNKSERIRRFIVPAFTPEFYAANQETVEKVCELREQNFVPETVYMQQLRAATTFDFESRLQEIKAETLVLTGDRDVVVPPQNSALLAEKISNARLKTIKNGSHMFFIENAAEFNQAVRKFILN
ncbi:MAG TPA: alpha/beta hydrolase [Pyrinomonadaceae bacterium]